MKKALLFLILVLILSACGNEQAAKQQPNNEPENSNESNEQDAEFNEKFNELNTNPELAEDNFIKETIENLSDLQNSLKELKPLFLEVNSKDAGWSVKVTSINISGLGMAGNNVSDIYLNDKLKEKFKNTLLNNDKTITKIQTIRDEIEAAIEIYDDKALNNIYTEIEDAEALIQTTMDYLEEESYTE